VLAVAQKPQRFNKANGAGNMAEFHRNLRLPKLAQGNRSAT
jgi:hypothetical protein